MGYILFLTHSILEVNRLNNSDILWAASQLNNNTRQAHRKREEFHGIEVEEEESENKLKVSFFDLGTCWPS